MENDPEVEAKRRRGDELDALIQKATSVESDVKRRFDALDAMRNSERTPIDRSFVTEMTAAEADYAKLGKLRKKIKRFREFLTTKGPRLTAYKELKRSLDALKLRLDVLRVVNERVEKEVAASDKANKKRKTDAPSLPDAKDKKQPVARRPRTKPVRQTEGDILSEESISARKLNAANVLTDVLSIQERILSVEKSAPILRDLAAVIDVIAEGRAFLYSPVDLFSSVRHVLVPGLADRTDWLFVVHSLLKPAESGGSPWFAHCLEKHLRDTTLRTLLRHDLDDATLAREVDRTIVALVEFAASPKALAEKRDLSDNYIKTSADESSSDSGSGDEDSGDDDMSESSDDDDGPIASDDDQMVTSSALLLALQSAAYEASGKDPRASPLTPGERRRVLDFYALTALHACLTHTYNVLKSMGTQTSSTTTTTKRARTMAEMLDAATALDKRLLQGLAITLNDKVKYDTLSTVAIIEALGGTRDAGMNMYVPAALWHWRSALLSDLAATYKEAAIPVPYTVANRYDNKSKAWVARSDADMATTVLPLGHIRFDGSLENEAVRWPRVMIDALFVWPAIDANDGLRSFAVQQTGQQLIGSVWPLMSLFDRRSNTRVLVDEAPFTVIPAPWSHVFSGGNRQPTSLLRNLKTLDIVAPLTAPVSVTLAVLRLTNVNFDNFLWDWDELSAGEQARWRDRSLIEWRYDAGMRATASKTDASAATSSTTPAAAATTTTAELPTLRLLTRGTDDQIVKASDAFAVFMNRITSKHDTLIATRTVEERDKVGHAYTLYVARAEDESERDNSVGSSVASPDRAPKKKKTKPENDTADSVSTTPTLSLPVMPPFSATGFDNPKMQEALREAYSTFWQRRATEFAELNSGWLDDPNVPPDEVKPWLADVYAALGLRELAGQPPATLPEWARLDASMVGGIDANGRDQLAWVRYYRFMNHLASVMGTTDTIHGYTLAGDELNIANLEDKDVGRTFPVVSAPQGAMLWSEWNIDVRAPDEGVEQSSTSTERDIPSLDIVPTPWTRGFDSVRNEVVFEFNPFEDDAIKGVRSTKPNNWFTHLATLYPSEGSRTRVDMGTLSGLHALAVAMPALASSDTPMWDVLNALSTEKNTAFENLTKEQRETRSAELTKEKKKLEKQLDKFGKFSTDTGADQLRIRITAIENELRDIAAMAKKSKGAKKVNRLVFLTHEDFPVHAHAAALVIMQFHANYLKAVGGELVAECVHKGREWLLTYRDRLVGTNTPLPLLRIQWLSDKRGKVQSNRIQVACPTETISLLTGACVMRTMLARAQVGKPLNDIGLASRRQEVAQLLYDAKQPGSLTTLGTKLAKDAVKNKIQDEWKQALEPFVFTNESERAWPEISNVLHNALASTLSFAAKVRLLTGASGDPKKRPDAIKTLNEMEARDMRVLLGSRSIDDPEVASLPSYPAADTVRAVSYHFRALLEETEDELMDQLQLTVPPEMPESAVNSDALVETETDTRAKLYTFENVPWVYMRNDILLSGLACLGLTHLASYLAPAGDAMDIDEPSETTGTSMAAAEYAFALHAARLVESQVLRQIIGCMGPLDMLDLALDYSPLAYQTLVVTSKLFGIPDAEDWYGLPVTIKQIISVASGTSRLDRAILSIESLVREFVSGFRLVEKKSNAKKPIDVPDQVSVGTITAHANALARFAAVLLSQEVKTLPPKADQDDIPLIDVNGNMLDGELEALDVSSELLSQLRSSRFKFGIVQDPDAALTIDARRRDLIAHAKFTLSFLQTIKQTLVTVIKRLENGHVALALQYLDDYVKAVKRAYLASRVKENASGRGKGDEDEEDEESSSGGGPDVGDDDEAEGSDDEEPQTAPAVSLEALLDPLIAAQDASGIVGALMEPLTASVRSRIQALDSTNILVRLTRTPSNSGVDSGAEEDSAAPTTGATKKNKTRVTLSPIREDDRPLMDGQDDDIYDSEDD